MQFPSHNNVNNENIIPESTHLLAKQQTKPVKNYWKYLKTIQYSNSSISIKTSLCSWYSGTHFAIMMMQNLQLPKNQEKKPKKSSLDVIVSWSKYYSAHSTNISLLEINAALTIISVHTLTTQYYCIKIIKCVDHYVNLGETPADICDQLASVCFS